MHLQDLGEMQMSVHTFILKRLQKNLEDLPLKHNVPIMSATQTTRGGFVSSDIGLEDTSESFGLPDNLMFASFLQRNLKT